MTVLYIKGLCPLDPAAFVGLRLTSPSVSDGRYAPTIVAHQTSAAGVVR
jgi:hypothetical protein